MEKITDWTQIALGSLLALSQKLMTELPRIFGAILLIIIGWAIAKIVSFAIKKALTAIKFDKLTEKINADEMLAKAKINITPSAVVSKFVYWIILLLFFVTASDTLGWIVVSQSIGDLIAYLPKLFSAIIIFLIGLYIANFIRKGLKGIFDSFSVASGSIVSSFAFYVILVIVTLTALSQAGIDTTIITSNVTLILGGIMLSFALSFGLGSRDVLANILSSYYTKNNFEAGQKIRIGTSEGEIEKIDNISCVLKTKTGKVVIPVKRLISEEVVIAG
ncbi:MAG: mechanosensitive ion channel family protein [Imperialibacter sp.]|uniref:mechanosensitive ion channel family protein n=1 Tax=Imperialibacter sp. TaxID=2038411 RepID=UPI0030DD7BD5|tara:strand:+ start:8368 stop:9195 length:828 start_codon:yes stop_codon:yes gene_type:complete